MKTLSLVLSLAFTATVAGAVLADGDNDATLKQISNYRQWMRVNSDPVEVSVPATRTDGAVSLDTTALT